MRAVKRQEHSRKEQKEDEEEEEKEEKEVKKQVEERKRAKWEEPLLVLCSLSGKVIV